MVSKKGRGGLGLWGKLLRLSGDLLICSHPTLQI